ncbi:MAG TPA: tetratricopeptide repeat protein, partial [Chryseolinea sp.]
MMKKFFLSPLLLVLTITLFAQQSTRSIDSLLLDAQFEKVIIEVEKALRFTSDSHQRVILENKKAEALNRAGKIDEAQRLLEHLASQSLPPTLQVITQMNLGFLFLNQGRNDLAYTKLHEALDVAENENLLNSVEGAQLLSYLGNLYLATGKYAQAEEQLGMALSIREKLAERNPELIAASYNDLGLVYSVRDANKALDFYEKALATYERLHGKDHPKTAIAHTNIGFAYRTLELYGDAVINFESALKTWEKIHPGPHPTKAFVLFNLGQTYLNTGNNGSARSYYDNALTMYRESYGRKHPAIATVLNAIGNLNVSEGKFLEGLEFFQQALISNTGDFENATLSANPGLKNYYSGNTLLFTLLHKAEALESRFFGKTLKFDDLALATKT